MQPIRKAGPRCRGEVALCLDGRQEEPVRRARASPVAEFRAPWPRALAAWRVWADGLAQTRAAPAQSQVGSYLVLFQAPHQLLCLHPQVSAQREVSGEETSSISLRAGLEAGPLPPPRSPSPSPRLQCTSPGSGGQTVSRFLKLGPSGRLKSAQEMHCGSDLTQTSISKPL